MWWSQCSEAWGHWQCSSLIVYLLHTLHVYLLYTLGLCSPACPTHPTLHLPQVYAQGSPLSFLLVCWQSGCETCHSLSPCLYPGTVESHLTAHLVDEPDISVKVTKQTLCGQSIQRPSYPSMFPAFLAFLGSEAKSRLLVGARKINVLIIIQSACPFSQYSLTLGCTRSKRRSSGNGSPHCCYATTQTSTTTAGSGTWPNCSCAQYCGQGVGAQDKEYCRSDFKVPWTRCRISLETGIKGRELHRGVQTRCTEPRLPTTSMTSESIGTYGVSEPPDAPCVTHLSAPVCVCVCLCYVLLTSAVINSNIYIFIVTTILLFNVMPLVNIFLASLTLTLVFWIFVAMYCHRQVCSDSPL